MILDTNVIFDLSVGNETRRPTEDDSRLVLVPSIQPTLEMQRAHQVMPGSNNIMQTSFVGSGVQSRTNQAANLLLIAQLGAGLWKLHLSIATSFNWASAVGVFGGISIALGYQGGVINLLQRIASVGTFVDRAELQLLLRSTGTLNINTDITGVGQSTDGYLNINAVRVI